MTDRNDRLQKVESFYENLYEIRHVEDCEISQMVTEIPHLNNDEAEMIEEKIALNEASVALRNMKHCFIPRAPVQLDLAHHFKKIFEENRHVSSWSIKLGF